jgi:hypothetical protein
MAESQTRHRGKKRGTLPVFSLLPMLMNGQVTVAEVDFQKDE